MAGRTSRGRWGRPYLFAIPLALAGLLALGAQTASAQTGGISGTLTDGNGGPAVNVTVGLFPAAGPPSAPAPITGTTSGSGGNFSFSGLAAGSYKLGFVGPSTKPIYMGEWYPDIDDPLPWNRFNEAQPIEVMEGQTTTVNAELTEGGYISGTVTDAGGPLEEICTTAHPEGGGPGFQPIEALTFADGTYLISGLPADTYRLEFSQCRKFAFDTREYAREYWNDAPSLAEAEEIEVTLGNDETGKDAFMIKDTIPPETRFTSAPAAATSATSGSIAFHAEPFVRYECSLDGAAFGMCFSPRSWFFTTGTHTFAVRAEDEASNVEAPPAEVTWTVSTGAPRATEGTVEPGEEFSSTGGSAPTTTVPVATSIVTPDGGEVSVSEPATPTTGPPAGYSLLGKELQISAPAATAGSPLRFTFRLDSSAVPAGVTAANAIVLRNGVTVGECPGSAIASPDPCVTARETLLDNDLQLTVLTSAASTWNLAGIPTPATPANPGTPPPAKPKAKKKKKKKKKKRRK